MKASRSARVGRVERDVGAAGLEDAEQRHHHARASARRRCRRGPPGPRPARAGGARAGWRAVELARRSAAASPKIDGHRVGRPLRLRLEQLVDARRRAGTRRSVSFHSTSSCCRSASDSSGSSRQPGSGCATARLAAAAGSARPAARASRRRTGRCCTRASPRSPSAVSAARSVRSNLRRRRSSTRHRLQRQPGQRRASGRRRVLQRRTSPGTAACRLRSRSRLQRLHQLLEGQVLVRVGPERRARTCAPAARRSDGSPASSVRSTSVLTKKPISPSSSARLRPAMGVPTRCRPGRCSGAAAP